MGKGTIVKRLLASDDRLWLSRSWTTRARREGESEDAYVFVDRERFEGHERSGGFLEWASFLDNLYGTPVPRPLEGQDVLLEIEVQGATQVRSLHPDALLVFLAPPSVDEQRRRLLGRGETDEVVEQRVAKAAEEQLVATSLGAVTVVNDDLDRAVSEIRQLIDSRRLECQ